MTLDGGLTTAIKGHFSFLEIGTVRSEGTPFFMAFLETYGII